VSTSTRWTRLGRVGRVVLALGALTLIMHLVGVRGIGRVVVMAAPWLPLALLIEGARIPIEARATQTLYGARGHAIPKALLLRLHFVGYAMTTALPAGRAVAEAYKATALSRTTSAALAAAVGTANQSLSLIANGIVAVPCAIAAYVETGLSLLTIAISTHCVVVVGGGLALQVASRSERVLLLVSRVSMRAAAPLRLYRDACVEHRLLPTRALGLHVVARALQTVGLGILLVAVTSQFKPVTALLGQAVSFVGGAAGDLIPLQLGATDGGWALAAPLLQLSAVDAVAITVLVHVVQVTWSLAGALVALVWRPTREPVALPGAA
jgi:hypothetical protein